MAKEHTYTTVDEDIVACNDCGAHADTKAKIVHHDTCVPGESKKWEEYYSENEE